MKTRAWLAGLLLAAAGARAEVVEELLQLPSAGEATLPVLVSRDGAREPVAAAVLFNGGGGAVGLLTRIPRPGANFLSVRARFVSEGVATAVIDTPTDLSSMSDGYRMGRRHADDVARVVAELERRFPGKPVFLVGTSRGTVSAAYAGAALGERVAGVVLTSSVFNMTRGGHGLMGFDWSGLKPRLLFVHHVDDACVATPYGMARHLSGPERPLVSVHGGDVPRSEPCEAFSAHGFLGVEGPVVQAIVQWMRGEAPPADVR